MPTPLGRNLLDDIFDGTLLMLGRDYGGNDTPFQSSGLIPYICGRRHRPQASLPLKAIPTSTYPLGRHHWTAPAISISIELIAYKAAIRYYFS
jgi:hypothetical protein